MGSIGGNFAVNDDGEATYRIPVWVPPGHVGMAPNLALTYRSHAGDSPLGVGFALEGTSRIARCSKNLADDGENGPPSFDLSDHYCLDSTRLMLVSGVYGEDAEYRTTPDSFARIRSVGRQAGGPAYFQVEMRDGRKITYSPRQVAPFAVVRTWLPTTEQDRNGNEIRYTYEASNRFAPSGPFDAEVVLSRIDYTYPAGGGEAPYQIHFAYETRPDRRVMYSRGVPLEQSKRLTTISIRTTAGQELRRYHLGYTNEGSSGRSKLERVTSCAGDSCLRPTTFRWTRGQAGIDFSPDHALSTNQYTADSAPLVGDLDGDGRTDIIARDAAFFARDLGFSPGSPLTIPNTRSVVTDADLDGRSDVLSVAPSGDPNTNYRITRFNGSSALTTDSGIDASIGITLPTPFTLADLNGDGRKDLVECTELGWQVRFQTAQGFAAPVDV